MKLRQYKIYWLEYHDPENWGGVKGLRRVLKGGYNIKKGVRSTVKTYPDPADNDGWHECEINMYFAAENKEKALEYFEKTLQDFDCETFSGYEKIKGKWIYVFNEDGMVKPEPPDAGEATMEEFERGIK